LLRDTGGPQGAGLRHPPRVFTARPFSVLSEPALFERSCWSPTAIPIAPSASFPQLQSCPVAKMLVKRSGAIHEESSVSFDWFPLRPSRNFGWPHPNWQGLVRADTLRPGATAFTIRLRCLPGRAENPPQRRSHAIGHSPLRVSESRAPCGPAHLTLLTAGLQGMAPAGLAASPRVGALAHQRAPTPLPRPPRRRRPSTKLAATGGNKKKKKKFFPPQNPSIRMSGAGEATFQPQPLLHRSARPCSRPMPR